MKNQGKNLFYAFLLTIIGLYLLLYQFQLNIVKELPILPTFLLIFGSALLLQSYMDKDYQHIFTGTFIVGIGINGYNPSFLPTWPTPWAFYLVLLTIASLLSYQKTKNGLVPAILFLFGSLLLLFKDLINTWTGIPGHVMNYGLKFWPILLIIYGVYLLVFRKK